MSIKMNEVGVSAMTMLTRKIACTIVRNLSVKYNIPEDDALRYLGVSEMRVGVSTKKSKKSKRSKKSHGSRFSHSRLSRN